jgi:hypothetical protein
MLLPLALCECTNLACAVPARKTITGILLAPRGAWLRQKSCQEISCIVVALLILKKCVSSDAL